MFSVKYLLLDEVDGFALQAGKEGDPISLAEARTKGYSPVRKRLYNSTPGVNGATSPASGGRGRETRCVHVVVLSRLPGEAGEAR